MSKSAIECARKQPSSTVIHVGFDIVAEVASRLLPVYPEEPVPAMVVIIPVDAEYLRIR